MRYSILLTNDDGYGAPGIESLCKALSVSHVPNLVAPASEQSGIGHAFTFTSPLHCEKQGRPDGLEAYTVGGTPSDCVKLGVAQLLEEKPDVIVSGMNAGENTGIAGHYSGTVAAAREGAFWGIPSVAFSLCSNAFEHVDSYSALAPNILSAIMDMDQRSSGSAKYSVFYNVNFPGCPVSECKGLRITRQSMAFFNDRYETISNINGSSRFQLYGEKSQLEDSLEYDSRAVAEGYATVTPLCCDATAINAMDYLAALEQTELS